ncbi:MAG TPA: ParA family protein [Kineosporiaceae bacterium]|nr:ParA family protein [Kineosporiaceae bacterium]
MTRTLAVANQKGGVAKTTTVVSLGTAFAEQGLRVLLVDLDAQSCLTFSLGLDPEELRPGVHEVILGLAEAADAVLPAGDGLDVLPATIDLAGAEAELMPRPDREFALAEGLGPVLGDYDVVLLDCSPSLGILTLNALAAADEVIIPLQCEMLSHRGVGQLLDTISDVRRILNPRLRVRGILPTMFDARTAHARAVLADVEQRYGVPVLQPPIPRSVRFAEAPGLGLSVLSTARRSVGARAYRDVAMGLLRAWRIRPGRRPVRRYAERQA